MAMISDNFGAILAVAGTVAGTVVGRLGSKTDARMRYVVEARGVERTSLEEIYGAANELYAALFISISNTGETFQRDGVSEGKIAKSDLERVRNATDRWHASLAQMHWIQSQEIAETARPLDGAKAAVIRAMNQVGPEEAAKELEVFKIALRRLTLVMNLAKMDEDEKVAKVLDPLWQRRKTKEVLEVDRAKVKTKLSELGTPPPGPQP